MSIAGTAGAAAGVDIAIAGIAGAAAGVSIAAIGLVGAGTGDSRSLEGTRETLESTLSANYKGLANS